MRPEAYVAHHFPNLQQQEHAARLGMWLFLATELLLFGGLFTVYSVYRYLFPETFAAASVSRRTRDAQHRRPCLPPV
jgi:cytochrome c oxidase subunit 3